MSAESLKFKISSETHTQEDRQAVLTIVKKKDWKGNDGWRGVIRVHGQKQRYYGAYGSSISKAASSHLKTHAHRISESEQEHLLKRVAGMQMRRTAWPHACPTIVTAEAPSQGGDGADNVAPSQGICRNNGIKVVHQMYGIFKDDKPMSTLFTENQKRWQAVTASMSAHYQLWTADEVESLVKQWYPQYWGMYSSVRYPVMRCDIGRLIILHMYGGLYADLDTKPNRSWYEQVELAVQRIKCPRKIGLSAKKKRKHGFSKKVSRVTGDNESCLDMEVIVGTPGNAIFIRWLNYIAEQIQKKSYDRGSFWYNAKMRYIFHTTGPYCMRRFFSLPCNAEWLAAKRLHYLECNHFKEADRLTVVDKRAFDVISYQSQSYFTDAKAINVPVGDGDKPIPGIVVNRRVGSKRPRRWHFSNAKDMEPQVAHSQEQHIEDKDHEEAAKDKLYKHALEQELEVYRVRDAELRSYIVNTKNCTATKVFMEDLPKQLNKWLFPRKADLTNQTSGSVRMLPKRPVDRVGIFCGM